MKTTTETASPEQLTARELLPFLAAATERELRRHKRLGNSIAGTRDGQPCSIPAEEIAVDIEGPILSPFYTQGQDSQ